MSRLFIALSLDLSVRESLNETADFLKNYLDSLKIVQMENFHITMKFLGELNEKTSVQIAESFAKIKFDENEIPFSLKGLGMFRNDSGGAIWAGIESDMKALKKIQSVIEAFTSSFGFEKDRRNFIPHITLARLRTGTILPEEILSYIKNNSSTFYSDGAFSRAVLYESKLQPSGPVYKEISEIYFKK
jgi:RNA 2',3'-cyclic 3'-phosphodiesterase